MTERLAEIRARVEAAVNDQHYTAGKYSTGEKCESCHGSGHFLNEACPDCFGTGLIWHLVKERSDRADVSYLLDLVDSLTAERDAALAQRDAELAALREKVRAWEALAREAVEEFDDARRYASDGYASEYFTKKWDYNETSVRFQERLGALSNNQEGR